MHTRSMFLTGLVLTAGMALQTVAAEPFKEAGGMVVMEGEHFATSDVRTDTYAPNKWQIETEHVGYVGTGYVTQNTPNTGGTNGTWANACELTYEITFSTPGTYSIWLRRYAMGTSSNSCFLGLDGVQIGGTVDSDTPANNQWVWMKFNTTVAVAAGKHVLNLRRRERGYCVDRIVMTADTAFTPSGNGPAESPQGVPGSAAMLSPKDKATDVARDTVLSWKPGPFPGTHNVYLGTKLAEVDTASAAVLVSRGQDANTYEPPAVLAYGQTYYWRIDEVNASPEHTVYKGNVWSFTVEPATYALKNITATASGWATGQGPEKTIDNSGLDANDLHGTTDTTMWLSDELVKPAWIQYTFDDLYKLQEMWVWNSNQSIETSAGLGAQDVVVQYSVDGITWTTLPGVSQFAKAPGKAGYAHNTTVAFNGVAAKYVKLTVNSNWGNGLMPQVGLSEVRFYYKPVQARGPQPVPAATGVAPDLTLTWRPGHEAAAHNVYFGTDPNALTLAGTTTQASFSPPVVNAGATYYWRVDEVNAAESPSLWTGKVWSFSTVNSFTIDDFESYNDQEGHAVYQIWIDGYNNSTQNGAWVGIQGNVPINGTFCDTTIFHGGKQAMPFSYANTGGPTYSEAERTFAQPQDWTQHGYQSLSLFFYGDPNNTGQMYLKVNNTKIPYNGPAEDLKRTGWRPWNIDLTATGANLKNVTKLVIGIEGTDATGKLRFDDIGLYPKKPEFYRPSDPGQTNLLALYACEGNANDGSGHGLNGTAQQAVFVPSERPGGGSAVKVEKAGYLDLGNPPSLDFGKGDWAVAAWYKTAMTGTGDANKGTVVGKGGDASGGKRYALVMSETTSGLVTLVTDDDVTKYVANSKSVTNDNRWHFVVGQRAGTTLQIYIDGQLENSTTIAATYDLSGTAQHNAYIGAITDHSAGSLYKLFNGLIDEVRFYNRALSPEEILWLTGYTSPVAKPF